MRMHMTQHPDIGDIHPSPADVVALANDAHPWPSDTARHAPLQNATFIKACIASGALVPPEGEGAAVRLLDYKVGLFVICVVACGLAFLAFAVLR